MNEEFTVAINEFRGPLDLMLHLIKEKKLDLFDLDMSVLADQYIDYIRRMEDLKLEIAGEYLSELASLIEYKSRKLLPRDNTELEEEYEEDTREKLVQRLLEYQRFKEVSARLEELNQQRILQFDKAPSQLADYYKKQKSDELPEEGSNMAELLKAMNQCIRRYRVMQPLPVSLAHKEVSAEERSMDIRRMMADLPGRFYLEDLCADCDDVYMVIVTFLAVLDMMKNGEIIAVNEQERIVLKRGAEYAE